MTGTRASPPRPAGVACRPEQSGTTVTISNERRAPIYLYPDGGCYDPIRTVVALHREGEWVDVFGMACELTSCAEGAAGSVGAAPPTECACPESGLVRLDPGAKLVIGPLSTEYLRRVVELSELPDAAPPGQTDGGVPAPYVAPTRCVAQRPLPAGEYELRVTAMSGIDPYCGEECDCTPGASGACVTRAQAGDGEVLSRIETVELPTCSVTFTF